MDDGGMKQCKFSRRLAVFVVETVFRVVSGPVLVSYRIKKMEKNGKIGNEGSF